MSTFLLYGATGYTGELIAREAVNRGLQPFLAGRNGGAVKRLADELECPSRAFPLSDPDDIAAQLQGIQAVLHCAGPFVATARPMMEACIRACVHYLDITGEIPVIETGAELDVRAKAAGIALLPAVGFDVVPTDCLAAQLAAELPDATHLILAFAGLGGGFSRGTLKTAVQSLPDGGRVRIDGRVTRVPIAWKTMEIPFRERTLSAMTIPWGDVASAYYSTGIKNIEVYMAVPRRQVEQARRAKLLAPLLRIGPLRNFVMRRIEKKVAGPTATERAAGRSSFWGRATNAAGQSVEATLTTVSGYSLTVLTSLAAVERVLAGAVSTGFATPSQAFGRDFIRSIPGSDLELDRKSEVATPSR